MCGAPNPEPGTVGAEVEGLIARGQQALNQGRPADAVEFLGRAVALEPDLFAAYFPLASAWHQLGNLERAIDCMMRARGIRPGSAAVYYNIGTMTARQGQRLVARTHLWEALRRGTSDPTLEERQAFLDRTYGELEQLGAITAEELGQLRPPALDDQGHPQNPELSNCLRALSGPLTRTAALAFHVAFVRSFLLVPEGGGAAEGTLSHGPPNARLQVGLITGPDGRPWFPAFSDAGALSAFRPGTKVAYTALPAVSIARMALSHSSTAGIVLNPSAAGGQPFERKGLEPIAEGRVLRLRI